MSAEFVTGFFVEAIKTAILLSAPVLLSGLLVGILVSIFQAATSINEMTLTFIPKMLAVAVALLIFFPWMLQVMIEYTQNLRIEEAKRLLETGDMPVDDISIEAGYEDASFFRRLFKRQTGLTPSQYRRLFQPISMTK